MIECEVGNGGYQSLPRVFFALLRRAKDESGK
jgi:hypothetical protein